MLRTRDDEDFRSELDFHRREWIVQRCGWVLLAIFLILALAGLFGSGPLSHARVGSSQAGTLEYERYTRRAARTTLRITPAADQLHSGNVQIAIAGAYLEAVRIEQITPEPAGVRVSGPDIVYEFAAAASALPISFHLQPTQFGRHTARIAINGGRPLTVRQFTYP